MVGNKAICKEAKTSIQKITSQDMSKKLGSSKPHRAQPRIPDGTRKHSVGLGVGQTVLLGDFRHVAVDSITFDVIYSYSASHSFDMIANLHYSKHSFKSGYVKLPALVVGIKARLFHLDSFSPFVVGGLGFYRPRLRREIGSQGWVTSTARITFGFHFGGGVDLKLNEHYTIGVLGQYHDPFDVKQEIGTDIEGSYFKLLITGSYTF
ncbi:MAG: outer membrane beta-barrel protein [Bacteriovoracaceae bacterium]|nr:outer membrane beta-barrel protein [Bacteriovoracaceae bacterium]